MFPPFHLQKETDSVSKTSCCGQNSQQWTNSRKPSNHKCREKYINSNYLLCPLKESANTLFSISADSCVWGSVKFLCRIRDHNRDAWILGARLPGQLNLVWWCLILVASQYGTSFMSPFWHLDLWKICAPLDHSKFCVELGTMSTWFQGSWFYRQQI
jgi:hypothetical protein